MAKTSTQTQALPPGVSCKRHPVPGGWAYVFRDRCIGELGRLLVQGSAGVATQFTMEVVGDPKDPMTAKRKAILEPLGLDLIELVSAALGPRPEPGPVRPPPRPPEQKVVVESKLIPCGHCDTPVALLIFTDDQAGQGQLEDYARLMYPEYVRLNVPTWVIGPTLGLGAPEDRPADIMQVWPNRALTQRLRPKDFNPLLDPLINNHCPPSRQNTQNFSSEGFETEGSMSLSTEHLHIAAQINAKVCRLEQIGANDVEIFSEMADLMPGFKLIMDSAGQRGMDELCGHYAGFYRYAKLLEHIAGACQAGHFEDILGSRSMH